VTVCPVSQVRFLALNVRPEASKPTARDSDFREVHSGPNPLHHLVYCCPDCLYAAYSDDFATLSPEEQEAIAAAGDERKAIAAGVDINGERTAATAKIAMRLAAACYARRAPSAQRDGTLAHRLAWIERELKAPEEETAALTRAVELYMAAYANERPTDPTTELTMLYTIGDVHLRLGRAADAVKWLSQASQHPEFRKNAEIQAMLRKRWTDARELARPKA
jgi:uncharacterized protein (DUF2225 family)